MTPHRALNWLLAAIMAAGLSTAYLLDIPSEAQARIHAAQAAADAEAAAQRTARFERAARAMCGENGAWQFIDSTTVQCSTHRGSKTKVARVAAL